LVDTRTFVLEESTMAKTRPPYTPEFRRQMVDLVYAGRSPEELAREFEPTAAVDPELGSRRRSGTRAAATAD
jgi:transposase